MSKKILVVDDSDVDRSTIVRILQKNGFEVIEAVDGSDGIRKAKEFLPDFIFMDVVMPNLSGFEATRNIGRDEATKHIPVIILSSKGMRHDQMMGTRAGAKAYLVKPPREDDILATLRQLGA